MSPAATPGPEPVMRKAGGAPLAAGVVIACTVGNFVSATPMVNGVFGVFLLPLSSAFGWPRAEVSGVLLLIAVLGSPAYPLVGRIADLYGARLTILVGNLLFAAAIGALSVANGSPVQVYLLFGLVELAAAIPSTVLFGKVVAGWFTDRRGLMLSVTAGLGNGVGATVMPGVAALLIARYGWRGAYLGLGLIIAALGFPVLLAGLREATRSTPAFPGSALEGLSGPQVRRSSAFRLVAVAVALGAGSLTALFSHIVAMLMDRRIAPGAATTVLMAFAFSGTGW